MIMKWKEKLYRSLPKRLKEMREKRIRKYLIGTETEVKEKVREQILSEIKVAVLLIAGLLVSLAGMILFSKNHSEFIEIERNQAAEGESSQKITIRVEGKEYPYELPVSEKRYTKKEREEAFQNAFSYLEKEMLGENLSFEEVREDMTFLWEVPGSPLEVRWEFEDEAIVDMEGHVYNDSLKKGTKRTHVRLILTYGQQKEDKVYLLTIRPKQYTKTQQAAHDIWVAMKELERSSRTQPVFQIPSVWKGAEIQVDGQRNPWGMISFFFILVMPLLIARQWELEKRMADEIQKSSQLEYSNILWQFILLLEAGLTIRTAWKKIVSDYEKRKEHMRSSQRYVYEQMSYAYHRMELGESQEKVFDLFSQKMAMKSYSKLMTLFLQNLTKGSKNMLDILKAEEGIAFSNRCEQAKRMGEEADTKLLLPMGVMLLNILLLLMVPAFMQF